MRVGKKISGGASAARGRKGRRKGGFLLPTIVLTMAATACAPSASNYPAYDTYGDLEDAADIIVAAEVGDIRSASINPLENSRAADIRILSLSKGDASVGDVLELHYNEPTNADFELVDGDTYIFFAKYYPEDGEAYLLTDSQGAYGVDGRHIMGWSGDEVEIPTEIIEQLRTQA